VDFFPIPKTEIKSLDYLSRAIYKLMPRRIAVLHQEAKLSGTIVFLILLVIHRAVS
jgi:hypothetical protein